jgi:SAM-dependent methyltransferase
MEKLRRLDFTMQDYSVTQSEGPTQFSGYTVTPRSHLKEIFKALELSGKESFIDIGCGKGFVLSFASGYNFRKVTGIDYSQKLCHIAQRNMDRLRLTDAKVYCGDASEFSDYDDYDVFFFFNPFGIDVFRKVMHKIEETLKRKPRKIKIAYYHPVCADYFDSNELFKLKTVLYDNIRKYETHIYEASLQVCGEQ